MPRKPKQSQPTPDLQMLCAKHTIARLLPACAEVSIGADEIKIQPLAKASTTPVTRRQEKQLVSAIIAALPPSTGCLLTLKRSGMEYNVPWLGDVKHEIWTHAQNGRHNRPQGIMARF